MRWLPMKCDPIETPGWESIRQRVRKVSSRVGSLFTVCLITSYNYSWCGAVICKRSMESSCVHLDIPHPCRLWPSSVCCLIWMTGLKGFVCTSECISDGCLATMAIRSPKMSSPSSIFPSPSCGVILALSPVTQAPFLCLCCCLQPFTACLSHAGTSVTPPLRPHWFLWFYFLISLVVYLAGLVYTAMCADFFFCIVFKPSLELNVKNLTG